jgi:hypothetical protein
VGGSAPVLVVWIAMAMLVIATLGCAGREGRSDGSGGAGGQGGSGGAGASGGSRRGRYLVYLAYEVDSVVGYQRLSLYALDLTRPEVPATELSPELSRAAGGIDSVGQYQFSPDGRKLLFVVYRDSEIQYLKVVDLGDPPGRTLLMEDRRPLNHAWSPDGRYLTYVRKDDAHLALVAVDFSGASPVTKVIDPDVADAAIDVNAATRAGAAWLSNTSLAYVARGSDPSTAVVKAVEITGDGQWLARDVAELPAPATVVGFRMRTEPPAIVGGRDCGSPFILDLTTKTWANLPASTTLSGDLRWAATWRSGLGWAITEAAPSPTPELLVELPNAITRGCGASVWSPGGSLFAWIDDDQAIQLSAVAGGQVATRALGGEYGDGAPTFSPAGGWLVVYGLGNGLAIGQVRNGRVDGVVPVITALGLPDPQRPSRPVFSLDDRRLLLEVGPADGLREVYYAATGATGSWAGGLLMTLQAGDAIQPLAFDEDLLVYTVEHDVLGATRGISSIDLRTPDLTSGVLVPAGSCPAQSPFCRTVLSAERQP